MNRLTLMRYTIAGMVVGLVGFGTFLYLDTPRRMPKKDLISKKTVYVSIQTNCEGTYAHNRQVNHGIRLPILLYHYVEDVQDPHDITRHRMNVSPPVFQEQLELLKNSNYTTVFIKDIPTIIENGRNICYPATALTFDDGYEDFYIYVYPLLKRYSIKATVYVIDEFIGKKDFMTVEQLKEISASGLVEIGSHTLSHLNLLEVSSDEARRQITGSRNSLSQRLGISIETFSYPFGKYSQEHERIVQEAGYTVAVTVQDGSEYKQEDLFQLPRIRPHQITGLVSL